MNPRLLLLVLLCLGAAPAGAQQVYSWTDANGTKHFSDTPPPPNTASAKKLMVHNGVTSEQADPEAADGAAKQGPAMAAAAGYSSDDIKRNCEVARKNLDVYNASKPAEGSDPEAQVKYQENINKAQAQIKLFCG
ncbi:MAG TPA: DUF4124 domain-containing protein [Dokdonella sp.]|nr:DUF4124 domain-containing protein [Dokdonella sp.]